ncbi:MULTISPECIES: hypothetical protein [unclassified Pseudomonas]|uniref:lysozyme inhibitor LprI family protein n=1 Tax=unclassified Pseudomonas TaxID=196821 RepID=UPI00128C8132|nr:MULTISPECIES: hypothetical protein [unclassified Pseudomonas]MPQ68140.1 hypothetical protein [Pseudomonas sp. MWU12-2323]
MKSKKGLLITAYANRIARLIIGLPLLSAALGVPIAHSAQNPATPGPSFSCRAANNAIEKLICSDPGLSTQGRTMAVLFAASRTDASGRGLSQQQPLQRQWLKTRDKQCSSGDMHACLVSTYDERLNTLAIAALFQAPDVALAELARQNPESAPLYEAIYRYATIENDADRATAVEKLIAPAFEVIHDKPWATPLSDIKDTHDVVSSDKNFSTFLNVASVSDYALTMPCSAFVRRPGLIDVLDSVYAGAIDGRLIRSDCEAMTSRLQKADQLTKAAVAVQPNCPGTIRFSLERDFDKTLLLLRLHRTEAWEAQALNTSSRAENENNGEPGKNVDKPSFIAGHQVSIRDAAYELATYYSSHFGVPPVLAKEQARRAVNAIISGAYNLCERG